MNDFVGYQRNTKTITFLICGGAGGGGLLESVVLTVHVVVVDGGRIVLALARCVAVFQALHRTERALTTALQKLLSFRVQGIQQAVGLIWKMAAETPERPLKKIQIHG